MDWCHLASALLDCLFRRQLGPVCTDSAGVLTVVHGHGYIV